MLIHLRVLNSAAFCCTRFSCEWKYQRTGAAQRFPGTCSCRAVTRFVPVGSNTATGNAAGKVTPWKWELWSQTGGISKQVHQEGLKILVIGKLTVFVVAGMMFTAPRHIRTACASSDSATSVVRSCVPCVEGFRTVRKGHRSGISAATAENQVASSLLKFDFLKGQLGAVLYFCWGSSSGVYASLRESPGHQLDRHRMTYLWVNTGTCSETLWCVNPCAATLGENELFSGSF